MIFWPYQRAFSPYHSPLCSIVTGLLALKKATYATPLLVPLIIVTILFQMYIGQKHWDVAGRLPSRKCLQCDRRNEYTDLGFDGDAYIQPEMRDKEGAFALDSVKRSLRFCLFLQLLRFVHFHCWFFFVFQFYRICPLMSWTHLDLGLDFPMAQTDSRQ